VKSPPVQPAEVYQKRLSNGRAAKSARNELERLGLSALQIKTLNYELSLEPFEWQCMTQRTRPERTRARLSIARALKSAAKAVAEDPEFSQISIVAVTPRIEFVDMRFQDLPSLSKLLVAAAFSIRKHWSSVREGDRRISLESYLLFRAHWALEKRLNLERPRGINKASESLVGLMLAKKIAQGTMTKLLGPQGRRNYLPVEGEDRRKRRTR